MRPKSLESQFVSEASYGNHFRNHALEHILPFWEKYSVDEKHGGFITHIDRNGLAYERDVKYAGMQGRMVYGFSVGYKLGGNQTYLELARHGAEFLIAHLWDKKFGGWYRSSNRDGKVKDDRKYPFGEAFAMLGLSEYYRETRDETALKYAEKTYELMDRYGWDKRYLGYYEEFSRNWAVKSSAKTVCTHLDMAEAIMSLYSATKNEAYLDRLKQLCDVVVMHMYNKKHGCGGMSFHRDWSYNPLRSSNIVNVHFGHNLKCAWLLLRMYELVKVKAYYTHAKKLIQYSIKYGWDAQNNGFFGFAYRNRLLANTDKIWWTQCEGILALLRLYRLTGDSTSYDYFKKITNFCFRYLFDDDFGEWFHSCHEDGTPRDMRKGGDWKAAYHTVQTCFCVHSYLKSDTQ